jgi:hypothetical protein
VDESNISAAGLPGWKTTPWGLRASSKAAGVGEIRVGVALILNPVGASTAYPMRVSKPPTHRRGDLIRGGLCPPRLAIMGITPETPVAPDRQVHQ